MRGNAFLWHRSGFMTVPSPISCGEPRLMSVSIEVLPATLRTSRSFPAGILISLDEVFLLLLLVFFLVCPNCRNVVETELVVVVYS